MAALFYRLLFLTALISGTSAYCQNETAKWYFSHYADLDFMPNSPQPVNNSAMDAMQGGASVADANGNLLFYTDGVKVWNSAHTMMTNGNNLFGVGPCAQPALIIRKPGSASIYYLFTLNFNGYSPGFYYSEIDMSLSGGFGAVTNKNVPLYIGKVGVKLTGTRHCNGTDYWVVIRDWGATGVSNFRSYLVKQSGVDTNAVVSNAWINPNSTGGLDYGCMKISPNGKKLAEAVSYYWSVPLTTNQSIELYDFDNVTGIVSNSIALAVNSTTATYSYGYGVEFSPDCTKLYATKMNNNQFNYGGLCQFDLCAGSPTAIAASVYTVAFFSSINSWGHGTLQLAKNGKIYAANWSVAGVSHSISVINNPNALGAACGYTHDAQSVGTGSCVFGLPNFIGSYFLQVPDAPPFSYSVSNTFGCQGVSFQASTVCPVTGFSLQSMVWDFGDPASGLSNTSTILNPVHKYSALGTYTAQLVLNYTCGGGSDTVRQVINVNQPCLSISTSSVSCAGLGSATVTTNGGIGPFSFTWVPTNQTGSVATALTPGFYTITVHDANTNTFYSEEFLLSSAAPFSGSLSYQPTVACSGAQTATAAITNITGGSASQNYLWTNGSTNYNNMTPTLGAGMWTVVVTDNLSGCTLKDIFQITQPSSMTLQLTASSPTACAGKGIGLHGNVSGGTAPYSYSWTGGPASDNYTVSNSQGGNYGYVLTAFDSFQCQVKDTIYVTFIANPIIAVNSPTICRLETATLQASGASSYVWPDNSTGSTFTANPSSSSSYWVTGSALGCTSSITALIFVKPLPVPTFTSNSPRCEGQSLDLFAGGGVNYYWHGPNNFTSNISNPGFAAASPTVSGQYDFTVTGANNCAASGAGTVTVSPIPTIAVAGATICATQALTLIANADPGTNLTWTGPQNFSSTAHNPIIVSPTASMSGNYYVTAYTASNCSNTAVAQVTITSAPVASFVSNSPLCEGETLIFNPAQTAGAISFAWQGPGNFTSSLMNPSIASAGSQAAGNYTLTVTLGPCVVSVSESVVVNALPQPNISGPDRICESSTFTLEVDHTSHQLVAYYWQYPMGGSDQQIIVVDSTQSYNAGVYTATVTDINGCKGVVDKEITVLPNPKVAAVGDTVCIYTTARLRADGASSYTWTGKNLSVSSGSAAIISIADYQGSETYVVIGTAVNGCTAISSAKVQTRPLPSAVITVKPGNRFCIGDQIELTGAGGKNFGWITPQGVHYNGQNVKIPVTSQQMSGQFALVVSDTFGCVGTTTTSIIVDPAPDGVLTGKTWDACAPFCVEYRFQHGPIAPQAYAEYYSGQRYLGKNDFQYCFPVPGEHYITGLITDTISGCTSTRTYVVNARSKPFASFSWEPEKPVEQFGEAKFTNTSAGDAQISWTWHIEGDESSIKTENCIHTFQQAGIYRVAFEVENKWGCMDTVVRVVEVVPEFSFYMPNAFTPGEDGRNDIFMPLGRGIGDYKLFIFDRWGEQVYFSADLHAGWDGSFRGQSCKSDVYIWKVILSTTGGEQKEYQGHVVLIR